MQMEDWWAIAQTLHDLAVLLYGEHGVSDHDQAFSHFREAVRELADRHAAAFTLQAFSAELGTVSERKALLQEAMQICQDMGDSVGIGVGLENFASLASITGHPRLAVKLLAAAQSQRERVGGASRQRMRLRVEELVDAARQRLSKDEAVLLEAECQAMSLQEAIRLATENWDEEPMASRQGRHRGGPQLTRRESEVARMVAQGLTNRQIANRLFISHRTAEYHVEQIRNKLGFHSRAQVAAWSVSALGLLGTGEPA